MRFALPISRRSLTKARIRHVRWDLSRDLQVDADGSNLLFLWWIDKQATADQRRRPPAAPTMECSLHGRSLASCSSARWASTWENAHDESFTAAVASASRMRSPIRASSRLPENDWQGSPQSRDRIRRGSTESHLRRRDVACTCADRSGRIAAAWTTSRRCDRADGSGCRPSAAGSTRTFPRECTPDAGPSADAATTPPLGRLRCPAPGPTHRRPHRSCGAACLAGSRDSAAPKPARPGPDRSRRVLVASRRSAPACAARRQATPTTRRDRTPDACPLRTLTRITVSLGA